MGEGFWIYVPDADLISSAGGVKIRYVWMYAADRTYNGILHTVVIKQSYSSSSLIIIGIVLHRTPSAHRKG